MAITYPLNIPVAQLTNCRFEMIDGVVNTYSGLDELMDAIEVTEPYIRLTLKTGPMRANKLGEWDVFISKLNGSFGTFLASDPHRLWPAAHPNGLAGYNGLASITSWQANGDVTIGGVNPNFVITETDWIEFEAASGRRTIVRALNGSTTGTSRTLAVRGLVDPVAFPAATVVRFYQTKALFRVTEYSGGDGAYMNEASLTARQVLR